MKYKNYKNKKINKIKNNFNVVKTCSKIILKNYLNNKSTVIFTIMI